MATKQYVSVFLSSTYKDLHEYRSAVWDALDEFKVAVNGMEIFGARNETSLKTSLSEISTSQIVVLLLGVRYGTIDDESGKSITELEYERAVNAKSEILPYLINEQSANVRPADFDVENAQLLRDFKKRVKDHHTVEFFDSPKDLAVKVKRDLKNILEKRNVYYDNEVISGPSAGDYARDVLNRFKIIPGSVSGQTIQLRARLQIDDSIMVDRERCSALGLKYGTAISRSIDLLEPKQASGWIPCEILADQKIAESLYELRSGFVLEIICKLRFGIFHRITGERDHEDNHNIYIRYSPVKNLYTGESFVHYLEPIDYKAAIVTEILNFKRL